MYNYNIMQFTYRGNNETALILHMWPYLRKPGIRDKSKMHWKHVEKRIEIALKLVEQRIANFHNVRVVFK